MSRAGLAAALTVAFLSGCASQGNSPVPAVMRDTAWMTRDAVQRSILMYVGGGSSSDVNVYDYRTGEQVGTLTGFSGADAGCVDAKGDVFIVQSGGEVLEYAHGGSKPIATYSTQSGAIGCSVDRAGDLAVTTSNLCVFKAGSEKATCYAPPSTCKYMWPAAYDDKGNLIVQGEYDSIAVCALPAGAKKMTRLSYNGTIYFPGAVLWDGKYITLTDQEANGAYQTGLARARLRSTTLRSAGETVLMDTCDVNYTDVVSPIVVGRANAPVNERQGTVVVGANTWCYSAGKPSVQYWKYPAGGDPYQTYSIAGTVFAVSIGT